mmetsp:Transcript_29096/g.49103  ORF Transcript_29096/g.49103 Transcript_29096/m.49103 type:complete len:117 (+) Transcript_29096:302-652(+)
MVFYCPRIEIIIFPSCIIFHNILTFLIGFLVYEDGKVCISILHPPGEDAFNEFETATERWRPIIGVESIIVSVMSMLSEPNDNSPANIDAAVMWREDKKEFKKRVRDVVRRSQEAM